MKEKWSRLNRAEKLAGISGLVLLIGAVAVPWWTKDWSAWGASHTDMSHVWVNQEEMSGTSYYGAGAMIVPLLIVAVAALALPAIAWIAALRSKVEGLNLPLSRGAIVTLVGAIGVVLVIIKMGSPPDIEALTTSVGGWLSLVASVGVVAGGWLAMHEEGTSLEAQWRHLRHH